MKGGKSPWGAMISFLEFRLGDKDTAKKALEIPREEFGGKNAKAYARKHGWDAVHCVFLELFDELFKNNGLPNG